MIAKNIIFRHRKWVFRVVKQVGLAEIKNTRESTIVRANPTLCLEMGESGAVVFDRRGKRRTAFIH